MQSCLSPISISTNSILLFWCKKKKNLTFFYRKIILKKQIDLFSFLKKTYNKLRKLSFVSHLYLLYGDICSEKIWMILVAYNLVHKTDSIVRFSCHSPSNNNLSLSRSHVFRMYSFITISVYLNLHSYLLCFWPYRKVKST